MDEVEKTDRDFALALARAKRSNRGRPPKIQSVQKNTPSSAIPEWVEQLASKLEMIANRMEESNQGLCFDEETKGYVFSHRACAEHIREAAKAVSTGRKLNPNQESKIT